MEIDERGQPAFARQAGSAPRETAQEGMRMREFYAAHCPITMSEAYQIWAMIQNDERNHADSLMSYGLRQGTPRVEFMKFYAQMRREYAEAMVAEMAGRGRGSGY